MAATTPLPEDVLAHMPVAVSLTRAADGRIFFVNSAWEATFGYAARDAVGRSVLDLGIYAQAERRDELLRALEKEGAVREFAIEFRRADGSLGSGVLSAERLERAGEHHIVTSLVDVSDRAKAETQAQVARDRFRRAFQDSGIGMAIYSAKGKYVEVNDALCAMFGYSADELLSLDWRTITHPEDVVPTESVGQAMREGSVIRLQKRYLRKDGSIVWAELTSSALREADGKVREFLTQIVDVTDKKRAEEEASRSTVTRRLARELLRQAGGGIAEQGARRELGRRLGRESGKQGIEPALAAFRAMGIGDLRVSKTTESAEGSRTERYEFESRDSLDLQPGATLPTCMLTLGFAEGLVTTITGGPSLGAEVRCQSQGHESCRIVVRAGPSA